MPHSPNILAQLGSSFGLAITTIIFNSVLTKESKDAGVTVNKSGTNAPYFAQEDAYKAAMWGGFVFGVLGAVLAALFLRHVGVVGQHRTDSVDEETTAHTIGETDGVKDEKTAERRVSGEQQ